MPRPQEFKIANKDTIALLSGIKMGERTERLLDRLKICRDAKYGRQFTALISTDHYQPSIIKPPEGGSQL
jgi:hypothetical protein